MARKGSPAAIAHAERQRNALELAKAGVPYDTIAQRLGYTNRSGAWKAVQAAMQATIRPAADDVRAMQVARLDDLLAGLWALARKGNVAAVDRALKIEERRAKLLGLDAAEKLDVSGTISVTVYRGASDDDAYDAGLLNGGDGVGDGR